MPPAAQAANCMLGSAADGGSGGRLPPLLRPEDFLNDDLALPVVQAMLSGGNYDGDMTCEDRTHNQAATGKGPDLSGGVEGGCLGAGTASRSGEGGSSVGALLPLLREIIPSARTLAAMTPLLQVGDCDMTTAGRGLGSAWGLHVYMPNL